MSFNLPQKDILILRDLAKKKIELCEDPVNVERRESWYRLDSGENSRPMLLVEAFGLKDEIKPGSDFQFKCESEAGRGFEAGFLTEFYTFDKIKDDHVLEPWINVPWNITTSNYGVETKEHREPDENGNGSYKIEHPIKDLKKDIELLKPRTFSVDKAPALQCMGDFEELFDGIIPVRIRGKQWWTLGLTWSLIKLIGLEEMMFAMYDNPDELHYLMKFLHDDHLEYGKWLEEKGLLTMDNENDYNGSGSVGYTRRHKQSGDKVTLKDQWVLLESQETVGVSPELFEEFVFPYQNRLAEEFASVYYGCCEPVHTRWHVLEKIKNLERVSVSPWCDQKSIAEKMGRDYVFSRKPNPTLVSTQVFNEDEIRKDLRETMEAAKDCRLEIIMKDVHTMNNEPNRISRWVEMAREEIAAVG